MPTRWTPTARRAAAIALPLALASAGGSGALAQDGGVAIQDIRAQAYLERSGRFSDDLTAAATPAGAKKPALKNLARPDSPLGEAADAVLVTLVFSGAKGTEASRSLARDMAQVSVKQTKGDVERTLLYRAFGGFAFGEDGRAHKAFLLDEATCAPLEIEVKVGRSRKAETLDLACDEPAKAEPAATASGKSKAGDAAKRR